MRYAKKKSNKNYNNNSTILYPTQYTQYERNRTKIMSTTPQMHSCAMTFKKCN